MTQPTNALSMTPARLRVLHALIAVWERDGRATVRSVADEAGRSLSVTWTHLLRLRLAGLADWWPDHEGTLRPTVRIVAVYE